MATQYIRYPAAIIGSAAFPLSAPSGSSAAPSYSFSSGTNYGMYFGSSNLRFASGGTEFLIGSATDVLVGSTTGNVTIAQSGGKVGFYGVTPVSRSATYTASNVSTDRSFDANSTSLDELADVLGTLITDLKAVGIIG